MEVEISAPVRELLSDEQIASVELQAGSGAAPCIHCGETIDPELSAIAVVMLVDPRRRRAAVRLAHGGCGESRVFDAELPGPGPGTGSAEARLAERWAAFVLPRVPLLVLQARADVWTDEERPALLEMLGSLGFESARELLDSDLFATGVGGPPQARGLELRIEGEDAALVLADGTVLETLPGALAGELGGLTTERGGAAVAIGVEIGLPGPDSDRILTFETVLPGLLERAIGAFVSLGADAGPGRVG